MTRPGQNDIDQMIRVNSELRSLRQMAKRQQEWRDELILYVMEEGVSIKEISGLIGISRQAVEKAIDRAEKRIGRKHP